MKFKTKNSFISHSRTTWSRYDMAHAPHVKYEREKNWGRETWFCHNGECIKIWKAYEV